MDVFTVSPEVKYRATSAPIRIKNAGVCVVCYVQDEPYIVKE